MILKKNATKKRKQDRYDFIVLSQSDASSSCPPVRQESSPSVTPEGLREFSEMEISAMTKDFNEVVVEVNLAVCTRPLMNTLQLQLKSLIL